MIYTFHIISTYFAVLSETALSGEQVLLATSLTELLGCSAFASVSLTSDCHIFQVGNSQFLSLQELFP